MYIYREREHRSEISIQKHGSEAGAESMCVCVCVCVFDVCVCVFSVQVRAGVLLSGSFGVLHHQRVREVFRGRSLHPGKVSMTPGVTNTHSAPLSYQIITIGERLDFYISRLVVYYLYRNV